jgi:hypothetical protein
MTDSTLVPAKSFEEKMKERIKDGIGDLLSDEEVKKLIDKGMDEVFLRPQSIPDPRGYGASTVKPCLLHEIVKTELQPIVTIAVRDYIAEHKEEVQAAITLATSQGMAGAMAQAINNIFSGSMINLQNQIVQVIQNMPRQY